MCRCKPYSGEQTVSIMQICKNYSVKAGVYREPKGRIVVERDRTRRVVNVYEL